MTRTANPEDIATTDPAVELANPPLWLVGVATYFICIYGLGLRWSALDWIAPRQIDETLAILIAPVCLVACRDKKFRLASGWYAVFIGVGVLLALVWQVPNDAVIAQTSTAIKCWSFLSFFFFFSRKFTLDTTAKSAAWITIILYVVFETMRFAAPDIHARTLDLSNQIAQFRMFGFVLPRMEGATFHPGQLAPIAYSLSLYHAYRGRNRLAISLAIIGILTFQLLDGLLFFLVLAVFRATKFPQKLIVMSVIIVLFTVFFLITLFALSGYNPAELLISVSFVAEQEARVQLISSGFAIAYDRFPLGSGFGTFGGVGAGLFNLDMYYLLGFSRFWWFQSGLFLFDSAFAQIIGETGYIGLFAFGSSLYYYGRSLADGQTIAASRSIWMLLTFIMLLSLASAAMYDVSVLTCIGLVTAALSQPLPPKQSSSAPILGAHGRETRTGA